MPLSNDLPGPQAVIVCDHVHIAYGREEVLHDVCLTVDRGAFLPVVGPNGAGKTTLLRAMLGLVRPRKGRIDTAFGASRPAYVSQQKSIDRLYPVSARQIVMMGLYPQVGWWRRFGRLQKAAVAEALERFGLTGHEGKTFGELSGGLRQKALLARAFVGGSEVFIMDEPTSELDGQSERDVLAHLHRLSAREGKTVVLAHHGLDHVAELAPVLCMVNHGWARLVDTRDALDVRRDPGEKGVPPAT